MHEPVDVRPRTTGRPIVRPLAEDEVDAWLRALALAFGRSLEEVRRRRRWRPTEPGRTLAVEDRGEVVATAQSLRRELSVPGGGSVPAGHVVAVSVLPTHRRRGLLTALMQRQLDDLRERGDAVAVLRASEGGIYGRYGYGVATEDLHVEIARGSELLLPSGDDLRTGFVDPDEARRAGPALLAAVHRERAGVLARTDEDWERLSRERGAGATEPRHVVATECDGTPVGMVTWDVRPDRRDPGRRLLHVHELLASTPEGGRELWRFLVGVDLVDGVVAPRRPVDDPLPWLLRDPRRVVRRPQDGMWLRVLDVSAALAARAYGASGDLVLEVVDPRGGPPGGRWHLHVEAGGVDVVRTSRGADVTLLVGDLASIYLGGVRPSELARAGRVHGRPDALARADVMFAARPPWSP